MRYPISFHRHRRAERAPVGSLLSTFHRLSCLCVEENGKVIGAQFVQHAGGPAPVILQNIGEYMEISLTQQAPKAPPWHRPFWKPVRGKEGVFAYLVLIHVLSVIGLILFPLP